MEYENPLIKEAGESDEDFPSSEVVEGEPFDEMFQQRAADEESNVYPDDFISIEEEATQPEINPKD